MNSGAPENCRWNLCRLGHFAVVAVVYPALNTTTTALTQAASNGWSPSQGNFFDYTVVTDPNDPTAFYTLAAAGKSALSGCTLTVSHQNDRTVTAGCELTSW